MRNLYNSQGHLQLRSIKLYDQRIMDISYKQLWKIKAYNLKTQSAEHTESSFDNFGFFAWRFSASRLSGCFSAKAVTVLFKEDNFNEK